ncbi:MAG TPA: small multi-drug export protein [Rubrivivax sp.]|nr:small multi-drug export protein [Rubrivivax sp.]
MPPPETLGTRPPFGWRQLLDSIESRILVFGLAMVLAIVLAAGVGLILAPVTTLHYAAIIGLNLVIGWGGGVSYGLASGLGLFEVVLCNLVADSLQVLVVFPLFVLGWRQLIDIRRLAPILQRLRAAAESQQDAVRRFGIAGLFLFVLVPFWMTGPLVGAVIGFLIGLHPVVNLAVVLSATGLAIFLYALFLEPLNAWASAVHPYAVFAVIVVLALLAWLARRWWLRHGTAPGAAK